MLAFPLSAKHTLGSHRGALFLRCLVCQLVCFALLAGCASPWNNPYPPREKVQNIFYAAFDERPKHLDPAVSYVENEFTFIGQIYEPPLQYHFLKRPYELIPLTATEEPRPIYLAESGEQLPSDPGTAVIAYSVYRITIRPGILYQPHPAFARDAQGRYLYHHLEEPDLEGVHSLAGFKETNTRELTAHDYVFQIKRFGHPKLHSPIAGLMGEYIVGLKELAARLVEEDKLLRVKDGAQAFLDLSRFDLEGARVIDRYTYEIKLKGKYPQFRYWLAMPFFAPMPWEADRFYSQPSLRDRNITLDWYPVGTGPYMLTENDPNRRMVLKRNPNFRGESYPSEGNPGDRERGLLADAGQTMPFIDKAVYSREGETIPYWTKFLQGYYDTSGINSDSFDQAIQFDARGQPHVTGDLRRKGLKLLIAVRPSIWFMGFNMRDEVVGGNSERARTLRRAVSIALDYEEFISIFANGRGIPAQGPIPPGIFGHKEGAAGINPNVYEWVDNRPRRRSLGEARALMAEAGYSGGRDGSTGQGLVLHFDTALTGPEAKARLDWLRKQFSKLGVQLDIRATDFNRFQDKTRKGTVQIFEWGWNADYPDPENFLFLLYGPNATVDSQGENHVNYQNPEFDTLFTRVKNMDDGPRRQAIIDQMVEILRRDAPWAWGWHDVRYILHHAWYKNAVPHLMADNTLKYKRIDPKLRASSCTQWNRPILWPIGLIGVALVLGVVPGYLSHRRKESAAAP